MGAPEDEGTLDDATGDEDPTLDDTALGEDPDLNPDEGGLGTDDEGEDAGAEEDPWAPMPGDEEDHADEADEPVDADSSDAGEGDVPEPVEGEATDGTSDVPLDGAEQPVEGMEAPEGEDPSEPVEPDAATAEEQPTEPQSDTETASEEEGVEGKDGEEGEQPASDETTEQSETAPPEQPSSGNETAAFKRFSLAQMEETSEGDDAFKVVNIFSNGSLAGPWEHSPKASDFATLDSNSDDRIWYHDGAYSDRISFQFSYDPEMKDYMFEDPVLRVDEVAAGVEPVLRNLFRDDVAGMGSFMFLYRCQKGGPERTRLSIHMQVTKNYAVDTMWIKICGSGRHEHMIFGFQDGDSNTVKFNSDGTYGTEERHTLEVGPSQISTVLTAQLEEPAWELEFEKPYLTSDSDDVQVQLRETVSAGTLNVDFKTKFSILYTCEQTSARANIRFTFGIPPWENMTATWRKVCGGTHSRGLLIGTEGSKSFDVMQEGELSPHFNVTTNDLALEESYGTITELDGKKSSSKFYLTNTDENSDLYIQTIAITMSHPEVVRAVVEDPFGSSYLPPTGGVIGRSETKVLKIHYICRAKGASLVMVTLPVQKFKNVEFGFIKHCLAPTVHRGSGFLVTAGSLLAAIFVFAVCGGAGVWYYLKRKSNVKYAPVATNEMEP